MFDGVCRGLRYGSGIAISNEFNRVCSQGGAVITYRQVDQTHRCIILDFEAVKELQTAKTLVGDRATSGPETPE